MKHVFRLLLIPIFILFSVSAIKGTVSNDTERIDSLLKLAEKEHASYNYTRTIFLGKKALSYSEEIAYDEGIVKSTFWIASGLCNMGSYPESFTYINRIDKNHSDYLANNPEFRFKLTDLSGRNYLALGFRKQAVREFKKELAIADIEVTGDEKLQRLAHANIQLAACYENYHPDSTIYYLNKVQAIEKIFPGLRYKSRIVMYSSLADYHLKNTKKLDSAFYYIEQALRVSKENSSYLLYACLRQKADILYHQKRYNESLDCSFKALALAQEQKRVEDRISIFKLIADNYHALGKYEKELLYINKHISIKDSLAAAKAIGVQISADRLSDEADRVKNKNLWYGLIVGISIVIVVIAIAISRIRRIKKRKRILIDLKENQINQLQDTRLDHAKNELITLGKKNAPEFVMKFKEAYPELYDKLLQIQPNLVTSELAFCAYLKLNFSTKEIATYIGVTPRAVQIRKNRIRKKLDIPSSDDLYLWMSRL
ncbi:hypothetical protein ACKW6Q_03445 [Chryseobacterium kwangjuense]|uniref:HTH luxR-type domain-containing protein n=1 Tax=Chryseobacterium kwangjuense TaxID=267125 RepID=A0ABW9K071_9FLAO